MSDPSAPQRDAPASGSHYQPSLSVVLVIVVLFVGATFLMVRAISPSTAATGTTTTTIAGETTSTTGVAVVKSRVRVQVANGTEITGLAEHFTQELMTQDWDTLPPGNGPHVTATTIYYTHGFQRAALDVAAAIKVSSSAVHPLHGNPVAGASGDDVIVILGPNSGIK